MTAPSIKDALELKPCPFCGSEIVHIESLARSFNPPRVYHEWHHKNDIGDCPVPKVVCSSTDDLQASKKHRDAWNTRATLSPPAGERREAIALSELVYKAVKVTQEAAGDGIFYPELQLDPADIITDYAEATDCWDSIAEHARDAILASGLVQDEAGWRTDLMNAPFMSEGKYQHCDLWVVNSDLGGRRETSAFRNADGEWCDRGGNKLDWTEIEAGVLTCTSRVSHWMPLPAPPIRSARDGGAET